MRIILGIVFLFISVYAKALIIEPLVFEMTTEKQGSIIITNPSNNSIAVDTEILEIAFNEENKQKSINNELLVFPPAFILKPNAKQHVRLIWNTDKNIKQSRSFYIKFKTPVLNRITDEQGSIVDVRIDYNALAHISQKEHQPILVIEKQYVENNNLVIEIYNHGKKHDYLMNYDLKQKNQSIISNKKLIELVGNVFFPPQRKGKLIIPKTLLNHNYDSDSKLSIIKISK